MASGTHDAYHKIPQIIKYTPTYSCAAGQLVNITAEQLGIPDEIPGFIRSGIITCKWKNKNMVYVAHDLTATGTQTFIWAKNFGSIDVENVTAEIRILYLPNQF